MINSKVFIMFRSTVSILSLIVSLVQITEFGLDFYQRKIKKSNKANGISTFASAN